MYLENINSPADVKKLSVGELTSLCAEMREALIQKLSVHGGHVGQHGGGHSGYALCDELAGGQIRVRRVSSKLRSQDAHRTQRGIYKPGLLRRGVGLHRAF